MALVGKLRSSSRKIYENRDTDGQLRVLVVTAIVLASRPHQTATSPTCCAFGMYTQSIGSRRHQRAGAPFSPPSRPSIISPSGGPTAPSSPGRVIVNGLTASYGMQTGVPPPPPPPRYLVLFRRPVGQTAVVGSLQPLFHLDPGIQVRSIYPKCSRNVPTVLFSPNRPLPPDHGRERHFTTPEVENTTGKQRGEDPMSSIRPAPTLPSRLVGSASVAGQSQFQRVSDRLV